MPLKIFAAGPLTTDITIPYREGSYTGEWLKHNGLLGKDKEPIGDTQREACMKAMQKDGVRPDATQGGSASNMLVTASRLLGDKLDITFQGIAGDDEYGKKIKASLTGSDIKFKEVLEPGEVAQAVTSFVFTYPDTGDRTIAMHGGNIKDLLKPERLDPEDIRQTDVVLAEGNLWKKLHVTRPVDYGFAQDSELGFADTMMKHRWEQGKQLWLAMPTHPELGERKASHFRWLNESANLILGNENELARVYTMPEEFETIRERLEAAGITNENKKDPAVFQDKLQKHLSEAELHEFDYWHGTVKPQVAFERLQDALKQETLLKEHDAGRWHGSTKQLGFITRDREGAVLITGDDIKYIQAEKVEKPKNKLGAGDTASGVFMGLYSQGIKAEDAASAAMKLTAKKLEIDDARLPNPKQLLQESMPRMAASLYQPEREAVHSK